jgi:hypothetical protein
VLVLYEPNANAAAALRQAADLGSSDGEITVVTLAPQATASRCCQRGPSVEVLNCVVRDEATADLAKARAILGPAGGRITYACLVATRDPPVWAWAADQGFDVIVLPSRRLAVGGHPLARRLRRATGAEIQTAG